MTETTQPDPQVVATCPHPLPTGAPCGWELHAGSGNSVDIIMAHMDRYHPDADRERPLTVADIPAGQGSASLFIQPTTRGIPGLWRRRSDGGVTYITDQKLVDPALWDHLAATLPHVTTEEGV